LNSKQSLTLLAIIKQLVACVATSLISSFAAIAVPGDLDPTFGNAGRVTTTIAGFSDYRARAIQVQSDGKAVVAGTCAKTVAASVSYGVCLVRYNVNGSTDNTFGESGQAFVAVDWSARTVRLSITPNGRLLLAGSGSGVKLLRLNSTGSVDAAFGTNGVLDVELIDGVVSRAADIATTGSGGFVLAAHCSVESVDRYCSARFSEDGVREASHVVPLMVAYSRGTVDERAPITLSLANGKLVVSGTCWHLNVIRSCVAQIDASGAIDASFGTSGVAFVDMPNGVNFYVNATARQSDGKLLVGGFCVGSFNNYDFCVARLSASGQLDTTFAAGGKLVLSAYTEGDDLIAAILVQSDQKIILTGLCTGHVGVVGDGTCVVRLTTAGTLDPTFGQSGISFSILAPSHNEDAAAAFLAAEAKLVYVAECWNGSPTNFCLARLKGGPYDSTTCTLNADLNNQVAGNDGVLAIRYLLGYTGEALTEGALGANPGRTSGQIESHFAQLKTDSKLDVDGDGEANALTDGLLILRAMLGLSGDALTVGAMGQTSAAYPTLRTAQQILQWIEATHGVACLP
jgi:uncharacterized delta-60 repeat protein